MLKGLALTPPVIGRISIGRVVERGGKRLPQKDDEFTVTSQVMALGGWVPHPVDEVLRRGLAVTGTGTDTVSATDSADGSAESAAPEDEGRGVSAKLRVIPVRLLFDDPDLNLRVSYSRFDRQTGRPICVGDGQSCRRATPQGIQGLPCLGPMGCEYADGQCKPYARLHVRIDLAGLRSTADAAIEGDELGCFVFRSTSFNSIRTLATRLRYFHATANGLLSTFPLALRLRGKSTQQSHRTPIYYVDLVTRDNQTLAEAVAQAQATWTHRAECGFNQNALDLAAKAGLARGQFEELAEEALEVGNAVVEEFYPETTETSADASTDAPAADIGARGQARSLARRLDNKLQAGAAMQLNREDVS
ncbi:MAG: phage capsid protein [Pseudomonadota bacterium]